VTTSSVVAVVSPGAHRADPLLDGEAVREHDRPGAAVARRGGSSSARRRRSGEHALVVPQPRRVGTNIRGCAIVEAGDPRQRDLGGHATFAIMRNLQRHAQDRCALRLGRRPPLAVTVAAVEHDHATRRWGTRRREVTPAGAARKQDERATGLGWWGGRQRCLPKKDV
jgi:hypothetical protein